MQMNTELKEKVDKISSYKTVSDKEKIDRLLELNANQYCNLGTDSYKYEREEAEVMSRYIYKVIKNIDFYLGKMLLKYREE